VIERCDKLPENLPKNIITTRIFALHNAYCESVGIDIFTQIIDGEITAIFGGMDGSYSLLTFENADFEELDSYFSFLRATVFCDEKVAEFLNCKEKQVSSLFEWDQESNTTQNDGHGRISDVYEALKNGEDGDIAMPDFDLWYTDFCMRFNHGAAEYSLVDGAVAVAGFMTDFGALITGVAVPENARKSGLGSGALKSLLSNIKKKYPNSKVFAATDNAAGFYIKNGFKSIGKVAVCKY
jgi:hypothetical protein